MKPPCFSSCPNCNGPIGLPIDDTLEWPGQKDEGKDEGKDDEFSEIPSTYWGCKPDLEQVWKETYGEFLGLRQD